MSKPVPEVVFVLGGPGAGKGTQCANLVRDFGFVHISAGDLLRAERSKGGSLGKLISDYIKEGKIIPVEITIRLIKYTIDTNLAEGKNKFLVDGFPRNQDNVEGWHKMMTGECEVKFVLFLDCPEKAMEERLIKRGTDSGRTDDNIASIRKRFSTYLSSTKPIIDFYEKEGKVRKVDASGDVDTVYKAVCAHFANSNEIDGAEQVEGVRRAFAVVVNEAVRATTRGDAEQGTPPAKKMKQFWELSDTEQKDISLKATKAAVFFPSEADEGVKSVVWSVKGAFFMSVSGGTHVYATEMRTDGTRIEHSCRINSYGVLERYITPCKPKPKTAEDDSCVIC